MTNTGRTTATQRVSTDSMRKTALVAGALYLLTFISIPRLALFGPVLDNPNYILGFGSEIGVLVGVVLELIVAVAIVGTGVALYPVLKRQNEGVALGFVSARIVETGIIVVGIISLLSVVTLRQDVGTAAGADAASLVIAGQSLVATQNWTFLIGQGLLPGINALLLGYLFYRSGLVPRIIPALGLIGAPLLDLVGDRTDPRHQRAGLGVVGNRRPPDLPVGALAWALPGLQGLQAFGHGRA